jgi:hypothetical protein
VIVALLAGPPAAHASTDGYASAIGRTVHRTHFLQAHLGRPWSPYHGRTGFQTLVHWRHRRDRLEHIWHPWPAWWRVQAGCIHRHESIDWQESSLDGSPGGGLQFMPSTWTNFVVRGREFSSRPELARKHDQLLAAWRLYRYDGNWHEWSTASMCGLV